MTTRKKAQQIAASLDDKAYAESFVEAEIATTVPFQIRALRKERDWTQTELADKAETHQKVISDFENPDIGPGSIASLLKIAAAFDVGLIIRFAPFSDLVDWSVNMTSASHFVPSRAKDTKLRLQRNGTQATNTASTLVQLNFDLFLNRVAQAANLHNFADWKDTHPQPNVTRCGNTLNATATPKRAHAS